MDHAATASEEPMPGITNIFVLMLENHSFDHVFAMSGICGIRAATERCCNSYTPPGAPLPEKYCVQDGAPSSMTTDPGHEFGDVLEQLCEVKPCDDKPCGDQPRDTASANCYKGGPYPEITLCGFARSYATSCSEGTGTPKPDHIHDIMACFHTPKQLPVINQLAREYAICDSWFSSLPGPTWPNRFFVHGASSSGMDRSPDLKEEVTWEIASGFTYGNGSIYDALSRAGHNWRLYQDKDNQFTDQRSPWWQGGWISQVAALKGISLLDVHSLKRFNSDLQKRKGDGSPAYLQYPYTFIEPNFGASFLSKQGSQPGPRYVGGSSQHPEDNMFGGEALLKMVYETIRCSPVWETSLLVIVYDEHGGFYDSVKPGPAPAPGDPIPEKQKHLNAYGFDFTQYGVRVPAVIVSPLIPKGKVDTKLYDHSSILATLEKLLGMEPLTQRDAKANDLLHLLSNSAPRDDSDCPRTLVAPAPPDRGQPDDGAVADVDKESALLPQSGNAIGFLRILLKAELELDGNTDELRQAILEDFKRITTHGHAVEYVKKMKGKIPDAEPAEG